MKNATTALKYGLSVFLALCSILLLAAALSSDTNDSFDVIFNGGLAIGCFGISILLAQSAKNDGSKSADISSDPSDFSPIAPEDPRAYTTARKNSGKFQLLSGLNMPTGTTCKVVAAGDKMVISALKQEYTLPNRKIIGVDIQTMKDFQKQYVSSIGGAVAGGVLLGPLGAILGGMAQQKTIKNTTPLLIVTYEKEPMDIQYINI